MFKNIEDLIAVIAIGVIIFLSSVCILEHNARVRQNERLYSALQQKTKLLIEYNDLQEAYDNLKASKATKEGATIIATCAKSGTIARKLNNPFNIKRSVNGDRWRGELGYDKYGHVHFSKVEYGIRAAVITLIKYYKVHKIDTVEGIIKRFCGGNNDYVKFVCKKLKLKKNQKFNVITRIPELLLAMSQYEGGKAIPKECVITLDTLKHI